MSATPLRFPTAHLRSPIRFAACCLLGLAAALPVAWGGKSVLGQQPAAGQQEEEIPEPVDIDLRTSDDLVLKATYYPGLEGKDSVPVVLLHALRGRHDRNEGSRGNTRFSREDYRNLAEYLRSQGHAVLVPDLRGHGESNLIRVPGRMDTLIDPTTMAGANYQRMVAVDLPVLKRFLVEKNNNKELNIEKLTVVAAEESAVLAVFWTQLDWSVPPSGFEKQGQDIKALILLSPKWSVPGLQWGQISRYQPLALPRANEKLRNALLDPNAQDRYGLTVFDYREEVLVRILVGWYQSGDPSDKPPPHVRGAMDDARKVYSLLKRHQDVLLGKFDTKTQGTMLLHTPGIKGSQVVAGLIDKIVGSRTLPWAERRDPYAGR